MHTNGIEEPLPSPPANPAPQTITEGLAKIRTSGNVFYNPIQEFNRDLSISVLSTFARTFAVEKQTKGKIKEGPLVQIDNETNPFVAGRKYDTGLTMLEGLSATGLRSIRYAKEVPGIYYILANDISLKAVQDISRNINSNHVDKLITASLGDATMVMYEHKRKQFDVIDLDPYGCPAAFLDGAVQAVRDGGMLLITATDMAVLAGNSPETCYSKYGAISLRMKSCHEMALRILLQSIESAANRYGRYIVPQLSISADFYIRVFVRIYSGNYKCKFTTSKLAMVYHCTGCDSFELQPLGILKQNEKKEQVKFALPTSPFVGTLCEHCHHPYHLGGPIWSAPIHNPEFVSQVLSNASQNLTTYKRIEGMLTVILEELPDAPLYYTLEKLSGTVHCETPPMLAMRSAILNAGFQVSFTHAHKTSIKTNAPTKVLWDIIRAWVKLHPVSAKWMGQDNVTTNILSQEPSPTEYSFEIHPEANPESRRKGFKRFQENPTPHWGPGSRGTNMSADNSLNQTKSKRKQGKRKRDPDQSLDNDTSDSGSGISGKHATKDMKLS